MNFINIFLTILLITILCIKSFETQTIKTSSGVVKGHKINVLGQQIEEYLGIPFVEPPIGSLRFGKPKPLEKPIEGIIDGTNINSCPQIKPGNIFKPAKIQMTGEDCLVLNIWCPTIKSPSKLKPVIIWIYGGAFISGSIFQQANNGSALATYDVCVVAANYRLGAFGFLYGGDETAPGNVAYYDQLLAIQWVRENIHLFGGDKNQITISGLSSGGWSVSAQLISPHAKGLFRRAVLFSGAYMYNKDRPVLSKEEAFLKAKQLAKNFKCEDNDQWLQCLRAQNVNNLRWYSLDITYPVDGTDFMPLMARKAFEQGQFNKDLDVLVGFTKDEGSFITYLLEKDLLLTPDPNIQNFKNYLDELNTIFHNIDVDKVAKFYLNNTDHDNSTQIRQRIYELTSDLTMKCPTYLFAKLYAQHSSPETNVFIYEMADDSGHFFPMLSGATHGSDLPFIMGGPVLHPNTASPKVIEFSKQYMKQFTDFVKNGKPDPKWKILKGTGEQSGLDIIESIHSDKNKSKKLTDPFKDTCNGLWKDYF